MLDEVFGIGPDYPRDVEGWGAIVHPDDRERMLAYLRDHVLGRGLPFDNEYRIRRIADGAERWVHGLGKLEPGPDGKPRRMFGVIQDVTQRKQTEERLARLLERLELAARAGGLGVWDWDPVTDEAAWDERVYELFGIPRGVRVTYERWLSAIHPEDRAVCTDTVRRALDGEIPYDIEFRVVRPEGGVRVLKALGQVLRDEAGRPVRVTGVNLDITERKSAEAQRIELERRLLHAQKLESLGVLAGGIAHDFNNLLMAVLGNLDLATRSMPRDSPARANLAQAMQATRRGTDLTRQMLAYSGKGRFVVVPVDLNELVRENGELLRTAIPRTVTLSFALAPCPALVQADP
jgi:PAS domain S-box-containing protein